MNPNTNAIMGSPIIKTMDTTIPADPTSAPVGMVAPEALVMLAVMLAAAGEALIALISENNGEITAASTNPTIKAHIAPIADSIRENEITGIFSTSLPASSNFTPPNLGTNVL